MLIFFYLKEALMLILPWHIDQRRTPLLQASQYIQMVMQQSFLSQPAQLPLLAWEVQ